MDQILVNIHSFHFPVLVLDFKHLKSKEIYPMTNTARSFAYRYFGFTYYAGKAYFGLA